MYIGVTVCIALEVVGVETTNMGNGSRMFVAIIGAEAGLGHLAVQFAAMLGWIVFAVETTTAMDVLNNVLKEQG